MKRSDVSNASRANWQANGLIKRQSHAKLLQQLCDEFGVDYIVASDLIFANGVVERSKINVAQAVAAAIINGPVLGIEPFLSLQRRGGLPGVSELQERLYFFLDGEVLCPSVAFPPPVSSEDRQLLRRIFSASGLTAADAKRCTESLCPSVQKDWTRRKNKTGEQCLEQFVTALHQPDIHLKTPKPSEVLMKLKRFGLSKRKFYTARQKTLPVQALENTSANRKQIEGMAVALKVDPNKFLHVLLEEV